MPIRITNHTNNNEGKKGEELDWLCDDSWRLPDQLEAFEKWLIEHRSIPKG